MNMDRANLIFDQVLSLPPGEAIRINCVSRADQDSTRSQIYRVRREYDRRNLASNITVQRLTVDGKFYVVLTVAEPQIIERIGADGEVIGCVSIEASENTALSDGASRIVAMMKEDGYADEEIEKFLTQNEAEVESP